MEEDHLCFSLSFFMLCEEYGACQVENFCVVSLKIELWIELRSGIRKLLSLLNIDLFPSNLLFLVENRHSIKVAFRKRHIISFWLVAFYLGFQGHKVFIDPG